MFQFHNFSTSSPVLAAQVQKPAPAFKAQAVVGGQIKEVSLEDYKVTKILLYNLYCVHISSQGKYVVVYFYPLDFTFVCPTEIIAFSDRIKEFEAINTAVLGKDTGVSLVEATIMSLPQNWNWVFKVLTRFIFLSGISTDSHYSHLAWVNQPRKQGGLGGLDYPLVSDFNKNISRDYGVLIEEAGIALRGEM